MTVTPAAGKLDPLSCVSYPESEKINARCGAYGSAPTLELPLKYYLRNIGI